MGSSVLFQTYNFPGHILRMLVGGWVGLQIHSSEVSACHPSINTQKQLSLKLVYRRDIVTWYIILLCLLKYKGPKTLKVKQIILN